MMQPTPTMIRAGETSIPTAGRLAPLLNSKDVPELTLMRSPHLAWVVPLLSKLREPLRVEDFHSLTSTTLLELRRDYPDLVPSVVPEEPSESDQEGRDRCLTWLRNSWLRRVNSDDGNNHEMYALTAAANEVLTMLSRISDPRTAASRTQFEAIRDLVHSLAAAASDDPAERMQRLVDQRFAIDAQIADLQQSLDEGQPIQIDDQAVREHVATLFTLTDSLPVSFRMVEQSVTEAHRDMIEAINSADEHTSRGKVLQSTLGGVNGLLDATEAGRTFKSLDDWLSSTAAHHALAAAIEAFLSSPGSSAVPTADRVRVRQLPGTLRSYIRGVQIYYADLTSGLEHYLRMTSHERTALNSVISGLDQAIRRALEEGWSEDIGLDLQGKPVEIESITRYALPKPFNRTIPPPDEAADEETARAVTSRLPVSRRLPLAQLIDLLNTRIVAALEDAGAISGGELFESLDSDHRSIYTLVDILRLAVDLSGTEEAGAAIDGSERQTVTIHDVDGKKQTAHLPRMTFMNTIPLKGTN